MVSRNGDRNFEMTLFIELFLNEISVKTFSGVSADKTLHFLVLSFSRISVNCFFTFGSFVLASCLMRLFTAMAECCPAIAQNYNFFIDARNSVS